MSLETCRFHLILDKSWRLKKILTSLYSIPPISPIFSIFCHFFLPAGLLPRSVIGGVIFPSGQYTLLDLCELLQRYISIDQSNLDDWCTYMYNVNFVVGFRIIHLNYSGCGRSYWYSHIWSGPSLSQEVRWCVLFYLLLIFCMQHFHTKHNLLQTPVNHSFLIYWYMHIYFRFIGRILSKIA